MKLDVISSIIDKVKPACLAELVFLTKFTQCKNQKKARDAKECQSKLSRLEIKFDHTGCVTKKCVATQSRPNTVSLGLGIRSCFFQKDVATTASR